MKLEALKNIGGKEWKKGDKRRVYFNDLEKYINLDVGFYKTGNVNCAYFDGERISNSKASKILWALNSASLWYDIESDKFVSKGLQDRAMTEFEIRETIERAIKTNFEAELTRLESAVAEFA